jgi:hypothetical protein
MKFFFPDSHDLVDPSFDFRTERRVYGGSRQQAQQYAHEVFPSAPYDGMLLSKAVIDGFAKNIRYSFTQVQRLKRVGVHEFLRLENVGKAGRLEVMGDCGSFTYVNEPEPPFSVADVVNFYGECRFDYGLSLDHVVLGYANPKKEVPSETLIEWKRRFVMTLEFAAEFKRLQSGENHGFFPIGVAQGWSPESYRDAVRQLQAMGYTYIALGGMVPLKTHEILASLEEVNTVRKAKTKLHLLGIARFDKIGELDQYGVASFDSTAPLKQAFMDERDNFHTPTRTYTAVRIPQTGENAKLKKQILSGEVDHNRARELEKACLKGVMAYAEGSTSLDKVLPLLKEYETLWHGHKDDSERYRETLTDRPWEKCPCAVCSKLGVHVAIFRGAERNRRRGFHNVFVLHNRLNHNPTT